jgi:hypothetical protein
MKRHRWIIVAAGIALALPAQAFGQGLVEDIGGTELIIYRFPGVRDDGSGSGAGVATVFQCTNFSGVNETIRFVVREFNAGVVANSAFTIAHLNTLTASTHVTNPLSNSVSLGTGAVVGGTVAIAATSTSLVCTAMILDASASGPEGIGLHGVRFNPAPFSQE